MFIVTLTWPKLRQIQLQRLSWNMIKSNSHELQFHPKNFTDPKFRTFERLSSFSKPTDSTKATSCLSHRRFVGFHRDAHWSSNVAFAALPVPSLCSPTSVCEKSGCFKKRLKVITIALKSDLYTWFALKWESRMNHEILSYDHLVC